MNCILSHNVRDAWIDPETGKAPAFAKGTRLYKDTYDMMDDVMKEGERYFLRFTWKGCRYGHIICAEKTPNGIRLFDPQSGEIIGIGRENVMPYLDRSYDHEFFRVDKLIFNHKYDEIVIKETDQKVINRERVKAEKKLAAKKEKELAERRRIYKECEEIINKLTPEEYEKLDEWRKDSIRRMKEWMEKVKPEIF